MEIIISLMWIILVGFSIHKSFQIIQFCIDIKRCSGIRFVTVPAHLLFKGRSVDNDLFTDDPLLANLLRKENDNDVPNDKFVNINYTLDLDQVKAYHEYTTETAEKKKVNLNSTYVSYKDGSTVVLDLPYFQFDEILSNYNNKKYNLI